MESNIIANIGPILLGLMMVGMGMALTVGDFSKLFVEPKAVLLGAALQLLMIPLVGAALVYSFNLPQALALGMIVLAACPGGPGSNIMSYIAKGDAALSVTLTALNSLVTTVTIPFVIGFALYLIYGESSDINILGTSLKVLSLTVIPVATGMLVRHYAPAFAARSKGPIKVISTILLMLSIVGAVVKEYETMLGAAKEVMLPAILLCIFTVSIGLIAARMAGLSMKQIKTLGIEVGIQNSVLAVVICTSILQINEASLPAVVYTPLMMVVAAVFLAHGLFWDKSEPAPSVGKPLDVTT